MPIDGHIRGPGIERRRIDLADPAPLRHILRRNVRPGLAFVLRQLNQAVIRAHPQQSLGDRRFRQRKYRVVIFRAGVVERDVAARNFLFLLVVARQIRADRLPVHAAVGRLKQPLAAVIQRVRIVRRKQDRRGPLKTMLQVRRPVRVGKLRLPP